MKKKNGSNISLTYLMMSCLLLQKRRHAPSHATRPRVVSSEVRALHLVDRRLNRLQSAARIGQQIFRRR